MSGKWLKTQIVVRVSDNLRDALQADAAANERTVAQSVRYHLRRSLGIGAYRMDTDE